MSDDPVEPGVGRLVGQPMGLSRHGAAGREQADSRQTFADPALHLFDGVVGQGIDRKNPDEPIGMRAHSLNHVARVMAVNGRRLHHHGPGNSRLVHGRHQTVVIDRAGLGPIRLMTAQRRWRIALRIRRYHVGMAIDNLQGRSSCRVFGPFGR